ncbi:nodulin MtN21 /EamA-like transporter family protein [Arabidopsis thaliana]|uniref:WAT1-related protein At3g28080 n=4 Tax=Arabidopsis thaliana TaxID=3702 RepID=WTR21_ARATH|nr:nodulin MtN21 /EamA-like transporter family protein [Arabidopsis thaliana]F4IYZ0.1 RecName: Full=WAT1-related protein At3g28080 [Arabidopsis thaliana]AEE77400.1 nodulin MtN21 /EamA-like transporter family protein [Arabidopsis thaliana]|eukprot:NP_566832.1 nodulin MtN21 /EamA-like transporter family protein [Arabidopsis thaliana]
MAGAVSLWRREAVFLTAMLAGETSIVGLSTLFKVATSKGLNIYPFLSYSYLLASLLLLPSLFFTNRSRSLPPLSASILSKIGLLGFLGSMYVITGGIGIEYSNPTLASAIGNIVPALTFILAVIFRMEKVSFKERSSVAKVMGTILSLIGAFVVIFYHGPRVFVASSPPYLNFRQLSPPLSSSKSDWLIGGAILTIQGIFVSVSFILQTHIMREYPEAFTVSILYILCISIVTSMIGLVVEKNNPSIWIIHFDITLFTIVTTGIITSVYYVIHSWAIRHKRPLYLAIFKPLSILIAVVMGTIFLNDSLYLGCLIGGILITLGFYVVMWGKANEEKNKLLSFSGKEKTPLLLSGKNDQI